jgi:hypothetical protein
MSPGWNGVIAVYLPSEVLQYLKVSWDVLKIIWVVNWVGSADTVWKNETSVFTDAAMYRVRIVINWLISVARMPTGTGTGVRVMGRVTLMV